MLTFRLLGAVAIVALATLSVATPSPASEPLAGKGDDEGLVRQIRESVVVIRTSNRTGESFGVGSGFVVDSRGLIATNFHVIGEGRPFTIHLAGGRELKPTDIVAADRKKDLAVIRVDADDLPALELGDSDSVRPGQSVLAVGNPLGFDFSVAKGVIAERRELDGRPMLQVAMPIEPGNSGSPLVDEGGRVVGIIAIKQTASLGFAVPVRELRQLLLAPRSISMSRWLTIGALDRRDWEVLTMGGIWRQRAGRLIATGQGSGFGGRMICLSSKSVPTGVFELAVDVKLEEESGAAGIVFHSDGGERHYGFYPTNGDLRLTRFEGPTVFNWTILETLSTPHYRSGEWNTVKVRVDGESLRCFVNDESVLEIVDGGLRSGRVGVCKFRAPTAEFRNFRVAVEIPSTRLDIGAIARVHELSAGISPTGPPDDAVVSTLSEFGSGGLREIEKRAKALEQEAFRLRHLVRLVHQRSVETDLAKLFEEPDDDIDLVRAALFVAKLDNVELDVESYVTSIDRIAVEMRERFDASESESRHVDQLVDFFCKDLGYRGSRSEYYHRSNSYINEVLEDREGLPITLSVVFLELARRLRLPVVGLGIPRHFVVGYRPRGGGTRIIDVFDGGKALTLEEVRAISVDTLQDSDLVAASKRSIIIRMLRNLSNVAIEEKDIPAILRYHDVILRLDGTQAVERWQRAVLRWQTGQPAGAASDLEWLLEKRPAGLDLRQVEELRKSLRQSGY